MNPETRTLAILTTLLATCFFCGAAPAMIFVNSPGLAGDLAAMMPEIPPTATFTVTRVPTATPTARPTFTPGPTRPSDQPTASRPEPRLTPIPTLAVATPANLLAPASNSDYNQEVYVYTRAMAESLRNVTRLSQSPRLEDQDWLLEMGVNLGIIQGVHEQLVKLRPPARFQLFHSRLLEATGDCHEAAGLTVEGLANKDPGAFSRSADLLESCGQKAAAALDELPAD